MASGIPSEMEIDKTFLTKSLPRIWLYAFVFETEIAHQAGFFSDRVGVRGQAQNQ